MGVDRWLPGTTDELLRAAASGVLLETHWLEVKREVGGSPEARKQIARALAGVAPDGGALIVGLQEDKAGRGWTATPQPLDGLRERVDQIARQLIDPPLLVLSRELSDIADPTRGYLVVEVPPSPESPHMVDGAYWGRAGSSRARLTDVEVARLHAARKNTHSVAERALQEEMSRDHVPAAQRDGGHLYLVAVPLTPRRNQAETLLTQSELFSLARGAEGRIASQVRDYAPSVQLLTQGSARGKGMAIHSPAASGPGRTLHVEDQQPARRAADDNLVDVELRYDGALHVTVGRLTTRPVRNEAPRDGERVVLDGLAVAYALRLVMWAGQVGERVGYRGQWALGLAGDRLRGASSTVHEQSWSASPSYYDADEYREVTSAWTLELRDTPGQVADRLVSRLLQALGTRAVFEQVLTDAAPPGPASVST